MFLDPLCRAQITKQLRCSSCPGPEGGLRRLSRTPPIKAPQLQVSGIAKWGSAPQGVTQQLAEHQHDLSNRIKTMEHFDGNATETDGHVRSPHSRNQYIRFRVSSHTHTKTGFLFVFLGESHRNNRGPCIVAGTDHFLAALHCPPSNHQRTDGIGDCKPSDRSA